MLPQAGPRRSCAQRSGLLCGSAWCSRPDLGACLVAAIIGSWLPWGVICGGSKSVGHVCGAFRLTAGPGASIIPVSRGAMGRVWCLDLGAERYAAKELFWESDEESVRQEVTFTAHLDSAGIRLPGSLPGRGGRGTAARCLQFGGAGHIPRFQHGFPRARRAGNSIYRTGRGARPGPGATRPWPTGGDGAGADGTRAACRW